MKIAAILILLISAVVAGCDYYGDYQARSFCSSIPTGSNIGILLSAETASNLRHYIVPETGAYRYGFNGFMFSAGVCEFTIANDKIVAKRAYHFILR